LWAKNTVSATKFTRRRPQQLRWYLYGGLTFERERFINAYWTHLENCRNLAQKYDLRLYEWNLVANPIWDFLCNLTGRDVPSQPFPFKFEKQYRKGTWQGVLNSRQSNKNYASDSINPY
jgi:Sulfotransferase domain